MPLVRPGCVVQGPCATHHIYWPPSPQVTPLFTGYTVLNPNVPTPVSVRCGDGPQPVNGSASASASAQQYLHDVERIVGDGHVTINGTQPKGTYNQSFAPGFYWLGTCALCLFMRCAGWLDLTGYMSSRDEAA